VWPWASSISIARAIFWSVIAIVLPLSGCGYKVSPVMQPRRAALWVNLS
jgi:hypothetical protein